MLASCWLTHGLKNGPNPREEFHLALDTPCFSKQTGQTNEYCHRPCELLQNKGVASQYLKRDITYGQIGKTPTYL